MMTKAELINRILINVPSELLALNQWVCWRFVQRDGKQTKVPFDIAGNEAESNDPTTWSPFGLVMQAYLTGNFDGIGFVFSATDPYTGIDFDDCIVDGVIDSVRQQWIGLLNSYSEYSQSGEGIHIIVKAKLPPAGRRNAKLGVEMYDERRFFVMTGDRLDGSTTINEAQDAVDVIHTEVFGQQQTSTGTTQQPVQPHVTPVTRDDQFVVGKLLGDSESARLWAGQWQGHEPSQSEADLKLCNKLAFWTARDKSWMDNLFRQSGLMRDKWQLNNQYRERTLDAAIRSTVKVYDPTQQGSNPAQGNPAGAVGMNSGQGTTSTGGAGPQVANSGPTSADYIRTITQLGYTLRLNELDDVVEVNGDQLTDAVEAEILTHLTDLGYKNIDNIRRAMLAHAYANRYHPVREYLQSLQWDGGDHIRLLAGHIIEKHNPIVYDDGSHESVGYVWLKRWLIGAVAKAMRKHGESPIQNAMLVFITKDQGKGKSTLAKWLCPLQDRYIEGAINPESTEQDRQLATKWIREAGELGGTIRKADREALKEFLSRFDTTFRKPFDRHPVTKPALTSFIGTVNKEGGFLNDPTGSRRFLTMQIEQIDWGYSAIVDVHQVWAQAYALWQAGESHTLNNKETQTRDALNTGHEVEDTYEGWVLRYFDVDTTQQGWFTTTQEVVDTLQTMGVRGTTRAIQMELSSTMRKLNLENGRVNRSGPRGYWGIRKK